ncbi:MAG: branched-chain amino acid ABC transporter permease [Actinomycetota bacterium]|nr:branched-chain amino acid ABC transporter permease [Actinomycetota bacterium]
MWLLLLVLASLGVTGAAEAQEARGEGIRGTLRNEVDDEEIPVAGAEITVFDASGEEVGVTTSGEDGTFLLDLPEPGEYSATLDAETLPDDVKLRDADRATLTVPVNPGQVRSINFFLGEDTRDIATTADRAVALAVAGIRFGLIIAITSVGLSLIFGTTGLTNFAHGELVTFGALMAYILNVIVGIPLVWAALGAMVLGGAASGLLDRGLWRPLRRRGTGLIAMLVISIGLSLLLRYVFLFQFGGRTRPFAEYGRQRQIDLFGLGIVGITPKDIVSIIVSLVVLVTVALLVTRTRMGKAMRAVADNPDLAASSGIDVQRVISVVWIVGGALAALGGVLVGLGEQVGWQMGFQLLLLMFAGITLGGLGTAFGALVGGFVIGLFTNVSTLVVPTELKNVGALGVLVLVLLLRPQGILGRAERVG